MSTIPQRASQPFALGWLTLRNRIVGAPHGRGMLDDGLALPADADYWRRVAAGGAAMVTVGGTVTARESTWRRRIVTEAWREEGIPGLARSTRISDRPGMARGRPCRCSRGPAQADARAASRSSARDRLGSSARSRSRPRTRSCCLTKAGGWEDT